jgi:two-component sensor histidine kinase
MAESLGRREIDHRLLINELNHRVKNTLATVQSVAAQSFRNAADVSQAQQNFEGRLLALSRTHDVLTREKWDSASILDIVAETIAPYTQGASRSRFRIEGPALRLPATIVLPLSMGLHELCTNAVKHGALSNQSGQVGITWDVSRDARELRLRWKESGGPVVYEPSRRGFGTRLVERILAQQLGGDVQLRFAPQGVSCELKIPLDGTEVEGLRAS